MANVLLKKYPLDRTAKATTNRIEDEPHTVGVQFNRIIAPDAGPYYEDSMVVWDTNGNVLVKGTDWDPILPYVEASMTLTYPVANMLVIKNKDVTDVVLKSYQVPGGLFQTYTDAIIDLINSLMMDNREVKWDNIGGKPIRFQPTPHLHHLKDLYGFEYEVLALEEILRAIQHGDIASHDVIYQYIETMRDWVKDQLDQKGGEIGDVNTEIGRLDSRIDAVITDLNSVRRDLSSHTSNTSNPHKVTKAQVGLGLVENYQIATTQEAIAAAREDRYLVPTHLKSYADANILPTINAHIADKNNPHGVTKDQVGLGQVANYPVASQSESETGTANNVYMTPAGVAQAINKQVGPILSAHTSDKNNPHGVTKAQVGLSQVLNYTIASYDEAIARASNERYMTPLSSGWMFDVRIKDYYAVGGYAANDNKICCFYGGWTRVAANLQLQHSNGAAYNIQYDGGSLVTFSSNISVNDAYIRSDATVKSNIRNMTKKGEVLTPRLRTIAESVSRYELNSNPGVEQIGVIAQAVREVMPELVVEGDDGLLSVKPAGMIACLLKGWRELDERINRLEGIAHAQ